MKPSFLFLCSTAFLFGLAALPASGGDGWTAYNDCVDTIPGTTPMNATNFGLGRSYVGEGASGNLLDFETGEDTGVTVIFMENFSTGNTINWAQDSTVFTPGTDAEALFGGILNPTGNMSYNDAPGWSLDLTFSNLNPARRYTFAATVDRNGDPSYASRVTNWSLVGAESSVYASSAAAHKVSEVAVEFPTGLNNAGLVARWTDIQPAPDGTFTIHSTHGVGAAQGGIANPDAYRGYAGGLFLLTEQPAPERPFAITNLVIEPETGAVTLFWNACAGVLYGIDFSTDLMQWEEISDSALAEGDTASYTHEDPAPLDGRLFYRVRELP